MHTHYNTKPVTRSTKYSHLTFNDRLNIERWKKEGKSNREIARLLGKAPQTINNEIKRGLTRQQVRKGKFELVYIADVAQRHYANNRSRSVKPTHLTSEMKETIVYYIKSNKYSPEMMVKRKIVSAAISTIYYWIHHGHLGLTAKDMLYPRRKKATKKSGSDSFRQKGQSIEERPNHINLRTEYGHYEIDTVLLTRQTKQCLLVMTDRQTRHQIIRLIPNRTTESVNSALKKILTQYQIKSITADNGVEFYRLSEVFDYDHIYFAHPYCSQERGTNENHNRLIRRFLPKGTKETTPEEVAQIENWINHYPKKIFNYRTPFEMMTTG